MALDWQRIVFTEHMIEAAAVVAECHIALDFEGDESVAYEVKVYRSLKGDGGSREKAERFLAAHEKKKGKRKSSHRTRAA